jgi:hypothetical protein
MSFPTAEQIRNVRNLRAFWDSVDPKSVTHHLKYYHLGWQSCLGGHVEREFRGTRDLGMPTIYEMVGITDERLVKQAKGLHRDAMKWLIDFIGGEAVIQLTHPMDERSARDAHEEAKQRLNSFLSKYDVMTKIKAFDYD